MAPRTPYRPVSVTRPAVHSAMVGAPRLLVVLRPPRGDRDQQRERRVQEAGPGGDGAGQDHHRQHDDDEGHQRPRQPPLAHRTTSIATMAMNETAVRRSVGDASGLRGPPRRCCGPRSSRSSCPRPMPRVCTRNHAHSPVLHAQVQLERRRSRPAPAAGRRATPVAVVPDRDERRDGARGDEREAVGSRGGADGAEQAGQQPALGAAAAAGRRRTARSAPPRQ